MPQVGSAVEMPDGRWGLTVPLPMLPLAAHREHIERAEAAGYTDLWSGETAGPDGFTPLALAAAWTDRVRLGTGVVGVFTRGPALLAQQAAARSPTSCRCRGSPRSPPSSRGRPTGSSCCAGSSACPDRGRRLSRSPAS